MFNQRAIRLGVNIDHVATLRNARGGSHPSPVKAAKLAINAGADGITAHLREDRRHINDDDVIAIRQSIVAPLNFEMAATDEMIDFALKLRPNAVCIVPERREELTTEGGLKVLGDETRLASLLMPLKAVGIRLSLFIEANQKAVEAAALIGADIVELHTGHYCKDPVCRPAELIRIKKAAEFCSSLGIEAHAGHGLDFDTVGDISAIPEIAELNIGHFLISESVFMGLENSIKEMRHQMVSARAQIKAGS